jgi:hypothetical protein
MKMNSLGPTIELHWKFYKTKKEGNEAEDGEDVVGWGRHLQVVCRLVTDARVLGRVSGERRGSIFMSSLIMRMTLFTAL